MNTPSLNAATDPRPIGVFDSGIGGLTVLKAIGRRLPRENLIYLGDTARVPYGTKSPRTVARYTRQVAAFLEGLGVKALVAACNTASALGLEALTGIAAVPAIGVIEPGCRMAAAASITGRIGVIGTRSTIASNAYAKELRALNPAVTVRSLACPLFVPLVEEGWIDHPATRLIVADTLQPLNGQVDSDRAIDALILGCTHYPLLKKRIGEFLGPQVALIDSAEAVAQGLAELIGATIAPSPERPDRSITLLATDVSERFEEVARAFLGDLATSPVGVVDLQS